jgi:DNA-binding transcriptional MerR regulator
MVMNDSAQPLIVFSTVQVSKLTGLTVRQLDYWAECEIFMPSVQRSKGPGSRKLYSADDVIQLRVLAELKCFRWSTQKIRNAIDTLNDVMGDSNPLRQAMLFGSQKSLFVLCKTEAGHKILVEALGQGKQQILGLVIETLEEQTKASISHFLNPK